MLSLLILVLILTSQIIILKSFYRSQNHSKFKHLGTGPCPVLQLKVNDIRVERVYDTYLNFRTYIHGFMGHAVKL